MIIDNNTNEAMFLKLSKEVSEFMRRHSVTNVRMSKFTGVDRHIVGFIVNGGKSRRAALTTSNSRLRAIFRLRRACRLPTIAKSPTRTFDLLNAETEGIIRDKVITFLTMSSRSNQDLCQVAEVSENIINSLIKQPDKYLNYRVALHRYSRWIEPITLE